MANNWIILDTGSANGVPVNLDFGTSVIYGGDIPAASEVQTRSVLFYQGVQNKKSNASYVACQFTSINLALAAYNRIIATMIGLGYIGKDLRAQSVSIASISETSAVHASGTVIYVVGSGFQHDGKITFNGVDQATTFTDSAHISFIAAGPASTDPLPLEYTDPDGNAATFSTFQLT